MNQLNRNGYLKTIREWVSLWKYSFWYEKIGIVVGIILDIIFYILLILFWIAFINLMYFRLTQLM